MKQSQQCPVCFGELEVRKVQPCVACGGWTGVGASKPEHHFTIRDSGARITLCNSCWLEEILSDQGDLKERLKINSENDLVVAPAQPCPETDKFCPTCNRRLALLKLMADRLSDKDLERWRHESTR